MSSSILEKENNRVILILFLHIILRIAYIFTKCVSLSITIFNYNNLPQNIVSQEFSSAYKLVYRNMFSIRSVHILINIYCITLLRRLCHLWD